MTLNYFQIAHLNLYAGSGDDSFAFNVLLGWVDGGGGANTLSVDQSAVSEDLSVVFQDDLNGHGGGAVSDATTGRALGFAGMQALTVAAGSGDDTFSVDSHGFFQPKGFSFDGGGGANIFTGDLSQGYGQVDFSLDDTPGAVSAFGFPLNPGAPAASLTNIQTLHLTTGDGADHLSGGGADDTIAGATGDNRIAGGGGDDVLSGSGVLYGDAGNDTLTALPDAVRYAPTVLMQGGTGDDVLNGLGGNATPGGPYPGSAAIYADMDGHIGATSGVTVDLNLTGPQDTGGAGVDTLVDVLGVVGTQWDDVLNGGMTLDGGAGNDQLSTSSTVTGGAGDDTITTADLAAYSGALADYRVTTDSLGVTTVQDLRAGSPDGLDTLTNVPLLQFSDQTIPAPAPGPGGDFDFSGSTDSYQVTLDTDSGSGAIIDLTTGVVTSLGGTSPVNVTTGSGDDTFTVTGSGQIAFNFNGGAGQNHFVGDFSQDALLTLDSTPGSTSTLIAGIPPFEINFDSLTNIQTVDVTTVGNNSALTGGDGDDRLDAGFGVGVVVDGGAGNDTVIGGFEILGGLGDDVLIGSSQAMKYPPPVIMIGGAGDDTLYGHGVVGAGPYNQPSVGDIATYSGDRADYSITTDAQGVSIITDLRPGSPDGTDTLISVAAAQFADSELVLLSGPVITASPQSNAIVEAGYGVAGTASATVSLQLTDGAGTPFYLDGSGAPLGAGQFLLDGVFGSAVLDTVANTLTYTLDDSRAATQALGVGQVVDELFPITIGDNKQFQNVTYVDFSIQGTNDAPTPGADSATTSYATPVTISAASLTANDADPDGFVLLVTSVAGAQHGSVTLSGEDIVFTPDVGYVGAAGFSYTVEDGAGGTATGQVAVSVTGTSPGYIYRAGIAASETIDTTGDAFSHNIVTGSGDDTVFTGSGGSSVKLGAGTDVVLGGTGKDIVTFGPSLDTVTGGAGPDNFIFVKGQIADPARHGGQYDTVTDFTGAGGAYVAGRDFIYLKGFAHTATITYEHDLSGDPAAHLYRVDDGAYHAEFVLDYAGAGAALSHSQYGFL